MGRSVWIRRVRTERRRFRFRSGRIRRRRPCPPAAFQHSTEFQCRYRQGRARHGPAQPFYHFSVRRAFFGIRTRFFRLGRKAARRNAMELVYVVRCRTLSSLNRLGFFDRSQTTNVQAQGDISNGQSLGSSMAQSWGRRGNSTSGGPVAAAGRNPHWDINCHCDRRRCSLYEHQRQPVELRFRVSECHGECDFHGHRDMRQRRELFDRCYRVHRAVYLQYCL
jgi:hypothetical protein